MKNRMLKSRVSAVVVTLAMLLTLIPLAVLAEENVPAEGIYNWSETSIGYLEAPRPEVFGLLPFDTNDTNVKATVTSSDQSVVADEDISLLTDEDGYMLPIKMLTDTWYQVTYVPRGLGETTLTLTVTAKSKEDGQEHTVGTMSRLAKVSNCEDAHTCDANGGTFLVGEVGNYGRGHVLYPTTLDQTILWESSDESVGTVDQDGYVTAVGVGECTITGTFKADPSISFSEPMRVCDILIYEENSPETDINGTVINWNVSEKGNTAALGGTDIGETLNSNGYWYSSNTDVATITTGDTLDENYLGHITFKKNGKVTFVRNKFYTKRNNVVTGSVTFVVTGCEEDAADPQEFYRPLEGRQGVGQNGSNIELTSHDALWNSSDETIYDDYITQAVTASKPEFTFTLTPAGKAPGGTGFYRSDEQTSIRLANSLYEEAMKHHVTLLDKDGNVVATGLDGGLEVTSLTNAPDKSAIREAYVTVTVCADLLHDTDYTLVFDNGTFGPCTVAGHKQGQTYTLFHSAYYHFTTKTALADATDQITALPVVDEMLYSDASAVASARAAYDAMTPEQQASFDKDLTEKLTASEARIAELEKTVPSFLDAISVLPKNYLLTLSDEDAVQAAQTAYEALPDDAQPSVVEEKAKLDGALARIEALKQEEPAGPMSAELTSSEGTELKARTKTTLKVENMQNGNPEDYRYKFIVYNETSKQWYKLQDYSDASTFDWHTGPAGVKKLYVDIKNKADETDITRIELNPVNVTDNSAKVTLTSEKGDALDAKTKTTLTATVVEGGESPFTYKFIVHNNDTDEWYRLQDFGESNVCEWYTANAASKTLYVDVKDANGKVVRAPLEVAVK